MKALEVFDGGFGKTRHAIACYGNMESQWIAAFLAVFQQNDIVIRQIGLLPVFDNSDEKPACRLTVEYAAPVKEIHPGFIAQLNFLIRQLDVQEIPRK